MPSNAKLYEYIERCRTFFDISKIGIIISDANGIMRYANSTFEKMFSVVERDYLNKPAGELFITAPQGAYQVLKTASKVSIISILPNGYKCICYRNPVLDDEGNTIGVIGEMLLSSKDMKMVENIQKFLDKEKDDVYLHINSEPGITEFIGENKAIQSIRKNCTLFAGLNEPVLITGESGTGKDIIANAIHASSKRSQKAFITVNCAAIPKELIESELFGYTPGSFTGARTSGYVGKFEAVDGGTIFLDEIGDLPLELQPKLLRVLESGEIQKIGKSSPIKVDFRLVAATNCNLEEMVAQGRFREDLYQRLNIFEIHIPSLRARMDDLPLLCSSIITQLTSQTNKTIVLSDTVLSLFRRHVWRGNVRELKNILRYAVCMLKENETVIGRQHLPERFFKGVNEEAHTKETISEARDNVEYTYIVEALKKCKNNKTCAAKALGMSRNNLYLKMKKYNIPL